MNINTYFEIIFFKYFTVGAVEGLPMVRSHLTGKQSYPQMTLYKSCHPLNCTKVTSHSPSSLPACVRACHVRAFKVRWRLMMAGEGKWPTCHLTDSSQAVYYCHIARIIHAPLSREAAVDYHPVCCRLPKKSQIDTCA